MIPGWFISLLTFPGVIFHEVAHRLSCDLTDVPVYKACYFRLGNPAGYVLHASVVDFRKCLLISLAPLLLNTFLCCLLTFPAVVSISLLDTEYKGVYIFMAWVGYSAGMHALPSDEDVINLVAITEKTNGKVAHYLIANVIEGLVNFANFMRRFWFDLFYAIAISWAAVGILYLL